MSLDTAEIRSLIREGHVHKRVYTDQAVFDLEMEKIFGNAWLYVAHDSQLRKPGDFVRSRMGKNEVIVTRDHDGAIHVLKNSCPHRGATVCSDKRGNVRNLVCGYHAWAFALDGTLKGLPHPSSYPEDFIIGARENSLGRAPRVEVYRGFVFASLAESGPSLREFLGPMLLAIDNLVDRAPEGEIELCDTGFQLEYRANWKMHHENANDTIHPGVVHESSVTTANRNKNPDTGFDDGQTRQMMRANGFGKREWESIEQYALPNGHSYMGGIYQEGVLVRQENDPTQAEYLAALKDAHGAQRAAEILEINRFNNLIYPNLNINAQYHQLRVVHPVAPDRTMVFAYCFRLKGAPEGVFHRAVRFLSNLSSPASMILGDDAGIFESCDVGLTRSDGVEWVNVQRGLGFDRPHDEGGVSSAATEAPIRTQFTAWLDYMTQA
ncbi:MAG: Rieske 2Fe-2S domain-containing protein [Pigmentiphaga sp.]|nr:Rieske 2Fe-2S domain-containing protein [Pigmentiphaga sp.]